MVRDSTHQLLPLAAPHPLRVALEYCTFAPTLY